MRDLRRQVAAAALMAGAMVAGAASVSQAATLDCSNTAGVCSGASGSFTQGGVTYYSFAGAIWTTTDSQATGSGVIDSFVRVSDNADIVSGMNTDYRPLPQDENSSPTFTHDITEGIVPVVTLNGQMYYEFLVDINQQGADPKLTLSQLSLCSSATGSRVIGGSDITCGAGLFYNMDTGDATNNVLLNYNFNSGSGSGDLFVYIPFQAIPDSNFIYLYSQFGGNTVNDTNNDGYEEWAIRTANPISPVPEPTSMLLLGAGLLGVAGRARRKNQK